MLKPLELFEQHKDHSTDKDINPNFVKPKMFMFRLQKIMDDYAGGAGSRFMTSQKLMEKGLEFLKYMSEDAEKLAAEDLHELMRVWENIHRLYQAEAHIHSMMFREETRWPGYYFRTDHPDLNENEWKCYVNCKRDPETGEFDVFKKEMKELVELDDE